MKIVYDCGCVVEYREVKATVCQISEASKKRITQAKKGRPLKSSGEIMGNARKGGQVQCTWFTPCGTHPAPLHEEWAAAVAGDFIRWRSQLPPPKQL
tara:strand:- start:250 stop:540 length:291 start_codon:yes stop_codon:yes gene_type:complete